MKNFICFFCITLLCAIGYSQEKESYSFWINKAELAMCDSNWFEVALCYDSAFSFHQPYPKDLVSAFWINTLHTNDKDRVIKYAHQMISCGDFEVAIRYLSAQKTDTLTYQILKKIEDTTKIVCDTNLMRLLDSVLRMDQNYHYLRVSPKEHRIAYRQNRRLILKILKTYPEIGISSAGFYYEGYLIAPCTHYLQPRERNYSIHRVMKRKVHQGLLDPYLYVKIEEFAARNTGFKPSRYGYCAFYKIGNVLFYSQPDNIKTINRNRHRIGIAESFEDYVKKVIWQYAEGGFRTISITTTHTANDAEEIAKLKSEIDEEHQKGVFRRNYYILPEISK